MTTKEDIEKMIFDSGLAFRADDKILLQKLIKSYFRKIIPHSNPKNLAGGMLWAYSRINFLFEHDEKWSQKSIADIFGIKPKTVSNTARAIMSYLKIGHFDERFARKEVADNNPMNNFFMTSNGLIVSRDQIEELVMRRMKDKFGNLMEKELNGKL